MITDDHRAGNFASNPAGGQKIEIIIIIIQGTSTRVAGIAKQTSALDRIDTTWGTCASPPVVEIDLFPGVEGDEGTKAAVMP